MADQRRVFKVAEKIRGILSMELYRITDPRFHLVTITSVAVSPDLRIAKIYWTVTGEDDRRQEVEEAFEGVGGLFRKALAEELGTRFVPQLKFFYDDTLDTAEEVERLMSLVREQAAKK